MDEYIILGIQQYSIHMQMFSTIFCGPKLIQNLVPVEIAADFAHDINETRNLFHWVQEIIHARLPPELFVACIHGVKFSVSIVGPGTYLTIGNHMCLISTANNIDLRGYGLQMQNNNGRITYTNNINNARKLYPRVSFNEERRERHYHPVQNISVATKIFGL